MGLEYDKDSEEGNIESTGVGYNPRTRRDYCDLNGISDEGLAFQVNQCEKVDWEEIFGKVGEVGE